MPLVDLKCNVKIGGEQIVMSQRLTEIFRNELMVFKFLEVDNFQAFPLTGNL